MIPDPPFVRLLDAAKSALEQCDWLSEIGIGPSAILVRHHRMRNTTRGEGLCVALKFIEDSIADGGEHLSMWEKPRLVKLDLVIEGAIEAEDSNNDSTGWLQLSKVAAASVRALRNPALPLRPLVDWVVQESIDGDENSTPDIARLVCAVNMLYRVSSEDDNLLFSSGV